MKMGELQGEHRKIYFELNDFYFNEPCDETEQQRTLNPTWIQAKKEHVEKDGSQKDSPERE